MSKASDPVVNIDTLLESVPEKAPEKAAPAKEKAATPEKKKETAAEKKIRELEEELAKPSPAVEAPAEPFVPSAQLSDEERQIRDLEDRLALKRTEEAEAAPVQFDSSKGDDTILIHFLEDGLTIGGLVWYRGQEMEFVVGSTAHIQQQDTTGASWLDMRDDPAAQRKRWGKQYIASGPWGGEGWGDTSGLSDPEEIKAAEAAAEAERRRGRSAPITR